MKASILVLALFLAACASDAPRTYGAGTAANPMTPGAPPPRMPPNRKVSEQDCSKPVDIEAGNLRCR